MDASIAERAEQELQAQYPNDPGFAAWLRQKNALAWQQACLRVALRDLGDALRRVLYL